MEARGGEPERLGCLGMLERDGDRGEGRVARALERSHAILIINFNN